MAGRKLTPEDDALWAEIKRTVRPLEPRSPPSDEERPGAPAGKRQTFSGASEIPQSSRPVARRAATPKPPPLLPGPALDRKSRRRLSRGREDVDDRLDLHGLNQAAAFHALIGFLRAAQADGNRLVLVITGKGRSEYGDSGVLRSAVPKWLTGPEFQRLVAGVEEAGRRHGGGGALYVRVRHRRFT
jgi:DNA-nicking Smr family endonuclease